MGKPPYSSLIFTTVYFNVLWSNDGGIGGRLTENSHPLVQFKSCKSPFWDAGRNIEKVDLDVRACLIMSQDFDIFCGSIYDTHLGEFEITDLYLVRKTDFTVAD